MRRFALPLAAIAAVGVAVRVTWVLAGSWRPGGLAVDSLFYHDLANLLAAGEGFVNPAEHGAGRDVPTADKPPLFPLLLAVLSKLGVTGIDGHRLAGCLLGGVTIVLLALLARRLAGDRVALVAAAIAAVHPFFVSIDGGLLTEALYGPLLFGSLLVALRLADRPSRGRAVAAGAVIGAAALTRPEAVLLLPLLLLPVLFRARGPAALPRFGLACLAALLVLAPWTIRNWSAFDRLVPISSQAGITIGGANCDPTYDGPDLGFWRLDCIPRSVVRSENEAERAEEARRVGMDYARDHAGRLPVVIAARLLRTWDLYGNGANAYPGGLPWPPGLRLALHYALLGLALAGLVLMRRRGVPLMLVLAPPAIAAVVTVVGFGYARFRFATDLVFTIPVAVALVEAAARLPGRRPPSAARRGPAPAA